MLSLMPNAKSDTMCRPLTSTRAGRALVPLTSKLLVWYESHMVHILYSFIASWAVMVTLVPGVHCAQASGSTIPVAPLEPEALPAQPSGALKEQGICNDVCGGLLGDALFFFVFSVCGWANAPEQNAKSTMQCSVLGVRLCIGKDIR